MHCEEDKWNQLTVVPGDVRSVCGHGMNDICSTALPQGICVGGGGVYQYMHPCMYASNCLIWAWEVDDMKYHR